MISLHLAKGVHLMKMSRMSTFAPLLVVALYTAYPFLTGVPLWNTDVPGADAEVLARLVATGLHPYRYYGHYFYLLFSPQLYYYLTPAIAMIPALWMKLDRWFMVWLMVLLGGFGYTRHMLMGSFLPVINYMVFIPLNLMLLSKGHYRWLVVSMFASLMFHGSSGIVIQAGTFLCMLTRLKAKDWVAVLPLAFPAIAVYVLNHEMAQSLALRTLTDLVNGNTGGDNGYTNYLAVMRGNGMLGRYDWANHLPVNWYFYYLGLQIIPALVIIGVAWARVQEARQYIVWLACFTMLPITIIIGWAIMASIRPFTFDMQDRASNALSIIIFMAAGLACAELLKRDGQAGESR